MRAGWYISGAGHLLLILVLLFGGLFVPERSVEVTLSDVSIISEAEFAALTPPSSAPEIATDAPSVVAPPEDTVPETPSGETAPEVSEPAPVEPPETPEPTPEVEIPQPIPDALVEDEAPIIETPPTDIDGSAAVADGVVKPAPRVAPTPSIAPPPDAEIAPEVVEDTAPDPTAEPEIDTTPQVAAAPEEASDRIVTEAEESQDLAPASSMRPRTRPARPVETVSTPEPAQDTSEDATADAIAAAVAAANTPQAEAPSGPPLTGGEKDAFRIAVSQCWVVDPGAQSAGVVVIVGFSLGQDGRVQGDVRQISASGGDANTQRAAFDAARRAVLRCQRDGFPLPVEKYEQWRDIEMTFNPEGMQFR